MITRDVLCWRDNFDRAQIYSTTPGMNGWTIADTSAAGAPTYLNVSGGGAALTIASTSEAENVCLYQNDVLPFDILKVQRMRFLAKVSGVDSATTIVMGLGSARNDTPDSVATNCWFRMEGSASTSAVVIETDDGTTDDDDNATGVTLSSTYKQFEIDFTRGLSDIRFYIDGAVLSTTTLSMAALTTATNVQPIFQIQKASGTGTPALTVKYLEIEYKVAEGA